MILQRRILAGMVILFLGMILPFALSAAAEMMPETSRVFGLFMNVGKADSAVFFLDDKIYMVDTGSEESNPDVLKALKAYNVTHIDGIMITHKDKDHAGGLRAILNSGIQVDHLYSPAFHSKKSVENHPVYQASEASGVPMTWLYSGDNISVNDYIRFIVLGPIHRDGKEENNNSLVLHLQTSEGSILLTGDMMQAEEDDLIQAGAVPKSDVLKIAHHGNDNTSSTVFLSRVAPKYAIISTDTVKNPVRKILKRLWALNISVAFTDNATCGISIAFAGGGVVVEAVNYESGIIPFD